MSYELFIVLLLLYYGKQGPNRLQPQAAAPHLTADRNAPHYGFILSAF